MEIKPNIYKGFCGDLRLFFDPDMYTIEDFRDDYLVWKEVRVTNIEEYLENFTKESKIDLESKVKRNRKSKQRSSIDLIPSWTKNGLKVRRKSL